MNRYMSLLVLGMFLLVGCSDQVDISELATKKEVNTKIDAAEQRHLVNLNAMAKNTNAIAARTGKLEKRVNTIETNIGGFVWKGSAEKADSGPSQPTPQPKTPAPPAAAKPADAAPLTADSTKPQTGSPVTSEGTSSAPVARFPVAATVTADSNESSVHVWRKEKPYVGYGNIVFQVVKDVTVHPSEEWMPTGPYPALYRWVKKPEEASSHLQARLWCLKKTADGWPPQLAAQWIDVERINDAIYLRGIQGYKERVDAKAFPPPDALDPGDILPARTPVIIVPAPVPCCPSGPTLLEPYGTSSQRGPALRAQGSGQYLYSSDVRYGGRRAGH